VERTFIAIKPDGVQRGLVGELLGRFERKGFSLVALKQVQVSRSFAERHYEVHRDKPFFDSLVSFITSGPVVASVWEGNGVVATSRKLVGATNPLEAEPGTIRGDRGIDIGRNLIHASDAVETAQREIALWFDDAELLSWESSLQGWIYE
jgi:nucleoside-diphosphate kinase